MKSMLKILIGSLLISLPGIAVMAQAPNTMMYQGRLTNAAGNPLTGTIEDVIFTIYDDTSSSKVALWSEVLPLTCNEQGVFTVELGLTTPLNNYIFNGSKRWLGITVDPDPEMSPLQLLTSAPYSIGSNTPGIVYREITPANSFINLPSSTASIDSVTINVPGPGYVYVSALVTFAINHTNGTVTDIYYRISDVKDVIDYIQYGVGLIQIPSSVPSGMFWWPTNVHKVDPVEAAGPHKYYFTVLVSSGYDTNDDYFDLQFTAMYFPTSYGVVSAKSSGTLKIGEADLKPGGNASGEQQ